MKSIYFTLHLSFIFLFHLSICGQIDSLHPVLISYIPNTSLGARDVHTDCKGNIIYVGGTSATSFECTPGSINSAYLGGSSDAFVIKVDTNGVILWSTLLGGPMYDRAYAVEVDSAGYIYVAGRAGPGMQTSACALQRIFAGDNNPNTAYGIQDGFVTKITPDGKSIVWCTYIGCDGRGFVRDIDLDSKGNVWVAISVASPQFPYITAGAVQMMASYPLNAALVKLSEDGNKILFGTFMADGVHEGGPTTVRVDQYDNVFFLSLASANSMPITPGAFQQTVAGDGDFVISKFNAFGDLLFCSFLGGSGQEEVETHSLEVDSYGNAIVAAYTYASTDYPVTANAVQKMYKGKREGVITKIAADGSAILASTYLGGIQLDEIEGIGIDAGDTIYVTGSTGSQDFPITSTPAYQSVQGGGKDGYIAVLTPDLSQILYATFIGGSAGDLLRSCHVDGRGKVYAAGASGSTDFPLYNAFFPSLTGSNTGIAVTFTQLDTNLPSPSCQINNSFIDPCFLNGTTELETFEMIVYPNPVSTSFSISGIAVGDSIRIDLLDLHGRILFTEQNIYAGQEFYVGHLPAGIYFIKGVSIYGNVYKRILLQ
jgi:hypothetical protein